jgi:hypothetical protein
MSALIAMKRQLEEYVDEFDPYEGFKAQELMARLCVIATKFPLEEQ